MALRLFARRQPTDRAQRSTPENDFGDCGRFRTRAVRTKPAQLRDNTNRSIDLGTARPRMVRELQDEIRPSQIHYRPWPSMTEVPSGRQALAHMCRRVAPSLCERWFRASTDLAEALRRVRRVGSSGLTFGGRSERELDSTTVIVDQTSLPTHVHPFSGTRRPIKESDPCF